MSLVGVHGDPVWLRNQLPGMCLFSQEGGKLALRKVPKTGLACQLVVNVVLASRVPF